MLTTINRIKLTFIAWLFVMVPQSLLAAELIMFEEAGCVYCRMWNQVIAPIYPKTEEGQFAPLRRIDISDQDEIPYLKMSVQFTPTFVLVEDGQEIGRIEGYPGEDFFWGLLGQMINNLKQSTEGQET